MKSIYSLFYFLLLISTSNAQETTDSIPKHDTFALASKKVNETRVINIWLPLEYVKSNDSFPVLYMLDGGIKEDFPHLANTIAQLIQQNKIKPIILVGIENTQRRRDLTGFTTVKEDKEIAPIVGGSEPFRAFIEEELFPEISQKYKINNQKGIIGESLAGLFITETFLTKPDMFDFYIAFDPSLWWNDKHLVKIANEQLNHFPTTKKTFWFGGSGEKSIYKSTNKLSEILKKKNISNLNWNYSLEKKEEHGTIFRATKEKALIWTLSK
jgi:predicted alpha/beta superfamily hydrolase